jgi:hypothetical protein
VDQVVPPTYFQLAEDTRYNRVLLGGVGGRGAGQGGGGNGGGSGSGVGKGGPGPAGGPAGAQPGGQPPHFAGELPPPSRTPPPPPRTERAAPPPPPPPSLGAVAAGAPSDAARGELPPAVPTEVHEQLLGSLVHAVRASEAVLEAPVARRQAVLAALWVWGAEGGEGEFTRDRLRRLVAELGREFRDDEWAAYCRGVAGALRVQGHGLTVAQFQSWSATAENTGVDCGPRRLETAAWFLCPTWLALLLWRRAEAGTSVADFVAALQAGRDYAELMGIPLPPGGPGGR